MSDIVDTTILHGVGFPNPSGDVQVYDGDPLHPGFTYPGISLPIPGTPVVGVLDAEKEFCTLHFDIMVTATTTCGSGTAEWLLRFKYNHSGHSGYPGNFDGVGSGGDAQTGYLGFHPGPDTCPTTQNETLARRRYFFDMEATDPGNATIFNMGTFLLRHELTHISVMTPPENMIMTVTTYDWYVKFEKRPRGSIIGV